MSDQVDPEAFQPRSPISDVPRSTLSKIQTGTMRYRWRGLLCNKNPFDLALYPMLLWDQKPRTIIEIGSKVGGSALWLDDICIGFGLDTRIISIDIDQRARIKRSNISFEECDARDLTPVLSEERMAALPRPLFVIEDADHHYLTSKAVLDFMAPHLAQGEYLIVEDGICDSMRQEARYAGGPNRAIAEMLAQDPAPYEIDPTYCDWFGYNTTWNTNGYLRRT